MVVSADRRCSGPRCLAPPGGDLAPTREAATRSPTQSLSPYRYHV
ncbi:hypothetical protein DVS28_b0110 (plasmid) [Euzebya pacifica]|uniref:Uncharacterized protein n=1 Tax=Euzebya pacifica TaxID=1608957 RepID=A0A346Y5Y3_9ACTN|nr:hypothetical protein DVS28_b0110 [Euzebya pacifica]